MISLVLALVPPAIFAAVNHIDKYLVTKYFRSGGVGALMIFSSLIGVFIALGILIIHPEVLQINTSTALAITANGTLYVLAILPYLYALQRDDVSNVIPLFQLTPVFSFLLEWVVLGTLINQTQLTAGIIIVLSAFTLSSDMLERGGARIKTRSLKLMATSSFLFATNALMFKVFAIETPFWTTSFYEYVGFASVALMLFTCVRPYRQEFLSVFHVNKKRVLGLNAINEIVNIVGKITFNAVSLMMPVTLVWIVGGFQPVFVFVYGMVLTALLPRIVREDVRPVVVVRKMMIISIMTIAAIFMG